ncbi:DNA primase family protein [Intrasporangium flavum]|uniref:DNA primase family protein n=1 Tax=Intrasporangium flavum TaxID=1428657 RepID=UPI001F61646B|nr:phage/plasmid primase, P4 family [Intrasporangium flavum]
MEEPPESSATTTEFSVEPRRSQGRQPRGAAVREPHGLGALRAADLEQYLDAAFGEDTGTAFVATGFEPFADGDRYKHGLWKETPFWWPGEAASLVEAVLRNAATGSDVYVCPYLMNGDRRAKGASVTRTKVHADIDGPVALDLVNDLGGWAVASGSAGHGHVYVDLNRSVSASWHEALCRGLGAYLGHADAKVSDNDLLRPPGTVNNKPVAFGTEDAARVEWLVRPSGRRWDPEDLADALGISLPDESGGQQLRPVINTVRKVHVASLPRGVRDALSEVSDDRSGDTMRVVGACVDAGLTLEETRAVVQGRTDLAERLARRPDDDVLRCWSRATESRAVRQGTTGPATGRVASVTRLHVAAEGPTGNDQAVRQHRGQARIAYRLAQTYGGRLMHVHGLGWHVWDGRRWVEDDRGAAMRAVLDVLRAALADSIQDKELREDVRRCESATGLSGVLTIAAALEPFAVTVTDLDPDPYLLNVANGTLDLHTLQLRPHDPADRITKVTADEYDPTARGPMWDAFLSRVLPDAEVRGFLQRYVGLALCGRVLEHVLAILTGTGRNGKGVFYGAVAAALGDYASTAEPDLFMHRENAHPTGEMDLLGLRWVVVSESDQGRRLAEATVKRLTGGDLIKARRMRQDFVAFAPSHTAALVTNHLPKVSGDDPALWARLRVVPFEVVIPATEQDPHLAEKLEREKPAILAWAVRGWRDYQTHGLAAPRAVRSATDEYQAHSDAIKGFLDDCCDIGTGYETEVSLLWYAWGAWRLDAGAEEISKKAFGEALEKRGFPAAKGNKGIRKRRGLRLSTEDGEADVD